MPDQTAPKPSLQDLTCKCPGCLSGTGCDVAIKVPNLSIAQPPADLYELCRLDKTEFSAAYNTGSLAVAAAATRKAVPIAYAAGYMAGYEAAMSDAARVLSKLREMKP